MIASIDGATVLAGLSGGLGGPADQALFAVLRSKADIVLVAAGTVRTEHYGPLGLPVAVVSRSCRLDWNSEFFTAATAPPIVITVADAPTGDRKRPRTWPKWLLPGSGMWTWRSRSARWQSGDLPRCLPRAAPTPNGQLAAAGLLDEVFLTMSPLLVGGDAK